MIDPARAYNAGVVQVNLNTVDAALVGAFTAALAVEDYDSPLVQSILAAQRCLKVAQEHPVEW